LFILISFFEYQCELHARHPQQASTDTPNFERFPDETRKRTDRHGRSLKPFYAFLFTSLYYKERVWISVSYRSALGM
jgi:hypothetical protein